MSGKQQKQPETVALTVHLTVVELSALSFVAVVVTSAVERLVVNAAERGLKKVRQAAHQHPKLPPVVR